MKKFLLKQSPEIRNIIIAFFIVTAVLIYFYFIKFQGNITGFFRIGSILHLSPYLRDENVLIYQGELGYDGQQFLSLAFDPFLQNPSTIASLDHPLYRYRRIFYPLLSYLLAWGNTLFIPYVMVGINYGSILLIVWMSSLYFKTHQDQAMNMNWQPLLGLCIPGIWITLSLSTADLLSSLFLVISLYCYRYNKPFYTAIAISLACLTRETMILMWLGILLTSIWQGKKEQFKYVLFAFLPPLLWNLYVASLKLPGETGVKFNFGYPFVGIFNKFRLLLTGGLNFKNLFELYLFLLLLLIFAGVFIVYQNHKQDNRVIQVCTLLLASIFSLSSLAILGYYLDYSRVYMDIYFMLLLSFNHTAIPVKTILLLPSGLASLAFLVLHS